MTPIEGSDLEYIYHFVNDAKDIGATAKGVGKTVWSFGKGVLRFSCKAASFVKGGYDTVHSTGEKIFNYTPPVIQTPIKSTYNYIKNIVQIGVLISGVSLINSQYKKFNAPQVIPAEVVAAVAEPVANLTAPLTATGFQMIKNAVGPALGAVARGLAVVATPLVDAAVPFVADHLDHAKGAVVSLAADSAEQLKGAVREAIIETANDAINGAGPLAFSMAKSLVSLAANTAFATLKETASIVTCLKYETYACIAAGLFLRYYLVPKIKKYTTGVPLPKWIPSRDACRVTPMSRAFASLKKRLWKTNELKPVLNEDIRQRVETIINANKNIMKNGGFFKNLLLLGDPGIGKTMLAKTIARDSNFNYVEISGADFAWKISAGFAIQDLKELIEFSKNSLYPTVLLIDEIDALCPYRDPWLEESTRAQKEFRSALLSAVQASKKLLIVGTTNLEGDMDTGLLSRFGNRIQMKLPDLESRVKILTQNIDKYLGKVPERATCLSPENIEQLAIKMEGMSGRALFQFVDDLAMQKPASVNHMLTQEGIDEVLGYYLEAHRRDQHAKEAREKRKLEKLGIKSDIFLDGTETQPVAAPAPVKPAGIEISTQTDPLVEVEPQPPVASFSPKKEQQPAKAKIAPLRSLARKGLKRRVSSKIPK